MPKRDQDERRQDGEDKRLKTDNTSSSENEENEEQAPPETNVAAAAAPFEHEATPATMNDDSAESEENDEDDSAHEHHDDMSEPTDSVVDSDDQGSDVDHDEIYAHEAIALDTDDGFVKLLRALEQNSTYLLANSGSGHQNIFENNLTLSERLQFLSGQSLCFVENEDFKFSDVVEIDGIRASRIEFLSRSLQINTQVKSFNILPLVLWGAGHTDDIGFAADDQQFIGDELTSNDQIFLEGLAAIIRSNHSIRAIDISQITMNDDEFENLVTAISFNNTLCDINVDVEAGQPRVDLLMATLNGHLTRNRQARDASLLAPPAVELSAIACHGLRYQQVGTSFLSAISTALCLTVEDVKKVIINIFDYAMLEDCVALEVYFISVGISADDDEAQYTHLIGLMAQDVWPESAMMALSKLLLSVLSVAVLVLPKNINITQEHFVQYGMRNMDDIQRIYSAVFLYQDGNSFHVCQPDASLYSIDSRYTLSRTKLEEIHQSVLTGNHVCFSDAVALADIPLCKLAGNPVQPGTEQTVDHATAAVADSHSSTATAMRALLSAPSSAVTAAPAPVPPASALSVAAQHSPAGASDNTDDRPEFPPAPRS